jgi:hypothetical protein
MRAARYSECFLQKRGTGFTHALGAPGVLA